MEALVAQGTALGTYPQWGMFLTLLLILSKQIVPWRQQTLDHNSNFCKDLIQQITNLRAELVASEKACSEKNDALQEELHGMRRQHIQEQISLINTIMRSVNAPELQSMIGLLEKVQQNLVVTRAKEHEDEGTGNA